MSKSTPSHIPTFSDIVNRVKKFRHKHCGRPADEEVPLGFLAEMSYALGHETSFRLVKADVPEDKSAETRLYELKQGLGNLYRFIENDGGIVSDENMKFLKFLMGK